MAWDLALSGLGCSDTFKQFAVGCGAFGEVSSGWDAEQGLPVALKHVGISQPEQGLPVNCIREWKALQSLHHRNIVHYKAIYPKGRSLVLELELCCTDLDRLLRRSAERTRESVVKSLLLQLLSGLAHMHDKGILHRDVKPSNLLLTSEGELRLADFGLARPHTAALPPSFTATRPHPHLQPQPAHVQRQQTRRLRAAAAVADSALSQTQAPYTATVATRWYRAPEVLLGSEQYGAAVDVWAAGVVFAELLGHGPLFSASSDIDQLAQVVRLLGTADLEHWAAAAQLPDWGKFSFPAAPPTPLSDVLPDATPLALALLSRLLRYDPTQRVSANEALHDQYFVSEPLPATCEEVAAWMRTCAELDC